MQNENLIVKIQFNNHHIIKNIPNSHVAPDNDVRNLRDKLFSKIYVKITHTCKYKNKFLVDFRVNFENSSFTAAITSNVNNDTKNKKEILSNITLSLDNTQ